MLKRRCTVYRFGLHAAIIIMLAVSHTGLWPADSVWLAWLIVGALGGALMYVARRRSDADLKNSPAPLIRTDATGRVTGASDSAAALFGAPVDELIGQRVQIGDDIAWSDRLAAIGELARGIAHELRNPLTAARNAAQLGLMFADPDKKDKLFAEVIAQADKLNAAIDDLTTFATSDAGPLRPVRVDQVIAAALAQIKGVLIMRGITIDCAFTGSVPLIWGNEQQLRQAVLNIINNSLQSMPDGGALQIRTSHHADRGQLELVISDSGAGMPPRAVSRVFRPFSGGARGQSSIGLTIASQIIVQRHSGTIACQSSIGGGTLIRVTLPVCAAEPPASHGIGVLSAGNGDR
ncbi:MAG: two-component system sensor histidine kinase NtrB [Chloroflexota bacterium]